jgi:hypothetical protein
VPEESGWAQAGQREPLPAEHSTLRGVHLKCRVNSGEEGSSSARCRIDDPQVPRGDHNNPLLIRVKTDEPHPTHTGSEVPDPATFVVEEFDNNAIPPEPSPFGRERGRQRPVWGQAHQELRGSHSSAWIKQYDFLIVKRLASGHVAGWPTGGQSCTWESQRVLQTGGQACLRLHLFSSVWRRTRIPSVSQLQGPGRGAAPVWRHARRGPRRPASAPAASGTARRR